MRTPSALVRRTGAALAAASAVLHGASLGSMMSPWVAAVMVVMIAGCLYCGYELLTRDTVRAWVLVAMMNLVMIGVHLPMAGAHHHGESPVLPATAAGSPMQLATAVAIVEVLFAATVVLIRTRTLAPVDGAPCQSGQHDARASAGRPSGRHIHRLPEPN